MTAELQTWLDDHEYESVDQLRGSMSCSVADPHERTQRPSSSEEWLGSRA